MPFRFIPGPMRGLAWVLLANSRHCAAKQDQVPGIASGKTALFRR